MIEALELCLQTRSPQLGYSLQLQDFKEEKSVAARDDLRVGQVFYPSSFDSAF